MLSIIRMAPLQIGKFSLFNVEPRTKKYSKSFRGLIYGYGARENETLVKEHIFEKKDRS